MQENQEVNTFDQYFEREIIPLVEEDNIRKDVYHGRFWGAFWSALFIFSANTLWVLFNFLMYKHPVNYEQILLVAIVSCLIVAWPIYSYYKQPRLDIFEAFLRFYGTWEYKTSGKVRLVHSRIIPQHDNVFAKHNISGTPENIKTEIRDTYYQKDVLLSNKSWKRTVSSGVIVYLTFPYNLKADILVFDKNGFYRKNKFPELTAVEPKLEVPASNYFRCFTDNTEEAQRIIVSLFYETILDLKEVFAAKSINIEIKDNFVRIYLENSTLYFTNYKFWSHKIDKNKFRQLHAELCKISEFIQILKVLTNV
ncbi:MAG: DUF3137 domain-containing protein [Alphaproteobacteria bacterium]|nr:DUF3137 domain-containing protein [Alphaproteobacteria bacterium]